MNARSRTCKTISGRRRSGAATVRKTNATTGRPESAPRRTASTKAGTSRLTRCETAGEKR